MKRIRSTGFCATCHAGLSGRTIRCPRCDAPQHMDCWQLVGGCSIYGCCTVPALQEDSATDWYGHDEFDYQRWEEQQRAPPAPVPRGEVWFTTAVIAYLLSGYFLGLTVLAGVLMLAHLLTDSRIGHCRWSSIGVYAVVAVLMSVPTLGTYIRAIVFIGFAAVSLVLQLRLAMLGFLDWVGRLRAPARSDR